MPKYDKKHPKIKLNTWERECLRFLLKGKTVKQIAKEINLSPLSVKFYIKNLRRKLDCDEDAGLMEYIAQKDFVERFGVAFEENVSF